MDADANANGDARGSAIALRERCSGELKNKTAEVNLDKIIREISIIIFWQSKTNKQGQKMCV